MKVEMGMDWKVVKGSEGWAIIDARSAIVAQFGHGHEAYQAATLACAAPSLRLELAGMIGFLNRATVPNLDDARRLLVWILAA